MMKKQGSRLQAISKYRERINLFTQLFIAGSAFMIHEENELVVWIVLSFLEIAVPLEIQRFQIFALTNSELKNKIK